MTSSDEGSANADGACWSAQQGRRDGKRPYPQSSGLAVLLVTAALALAACSGSSAPNAASSPTVASLGTSTSNGGGNGNGSGTSTTSPHAGNPTQLMDEWAACMRSHGDPDQTDPIIDAHGVINITMPKGVTGALSSEAHGSSGPCSPYELAAENALRGGEPDPTGPSQAQLVQYTDCMRSNGVPNYPDPGSDGRTDFNGTGVDPNSPSVENANKVCGKEINAPAWWIAGTGPPGDVVVTSAGLPPNGGPHPGQVGTGNQVPVNNG
jgi:hypothetical protein